MSETIRIKTLWGWRRSEETPELMEAWDEYTVDANPDGFQEACDRSIASWGSDLHAHRDIDLVVDLDKVREAFFRTTIEAELEPIGGITGAKEPENAS